MWACTVPACNHTHTHTHKTHRHTLTRVCSFFSPFACSLEQEVMLHQLSLAVQQPPPQPRWVWWLFDCDQSFSFPQPSSQWLEMSLTWSHAPIDLVITVLGYVLHVSDYYMMLYQVESCMPSWLLLTCPAIQWTVCLSAILYSNVIVNACYNAAGCLQYCTSALCNLNFT